MGDFRAAPGNPKRPSPLKHGSPRAEAGRSHQALTSACGGLQLELPPHTRGQRNPPPERMILKRTPLIVLTCFTTGRNFLMPGHRVFISLLLTPLLSVSCARPSATTGNSASPTVYVAVGDSTGLGLGARDGGGYVDRLFARIEQKRPGSTLLTSPPQELRQPMWLINSFLG